MGSTSSSVQLRARITCPHCWHVFTPEEVLWISAHPDLRGDPVLGQDAQQRFLPTRFTVEGHAIDVKGVTCHHLACPRCHLSVARALLEMQPLFVSILGAPSAGKSYFLASMTYKLRNTLQTRFSLSFLDADAAANQILTDYEDTLFRNPQDDRLVTLPKTEKEGELYEAVSFGDREVWYPRPFVFSVQPMEGHPGFAKRNLISRALCLYDNAGEQFLPGEESPNSPGTQHLALSEVLLFLFDPTQHKEFRKACEGRTEDPQMGKHGWIHRQDLILQEAANRVRAFSNLPASEKYPRPLVVVVTKFDAWAALTRVERIEANRIIHKVNDAMSALDLKEIQKLSGQMRKILGRLAPELVAAAEGFSANVIYVPVSALGAGPEVNKEADGVLGIRPKNINPMCAEIPLLFALNRASPGLVRSGQAGAAPKSSLPESAAEPSDESDETRSPRLWKETGS